MRIPMHTCVSRPGIQSDACLRRVLFARSVQEELLARAAAAAQKKS